jgi:predicted nucleic acid-binding Zn ribbon protein
VQSFSDPAVATCPQCGAPVRKVYGSVGVVFKGSGFYRTDSRKAESATSAAGSTKESSSAGTSAANGSSAPKKDSSSSPPASGAGSKAAN